jgi:hypothetical protein
VALFTAAPTDVAASGTEVTGGSYARKSTAAADWNASSSGQSTNANAITFTTPTADWGDVVAVGLFDASTSGNCLAWDWTGDFDYLPFTAATNDTITCPAHGYSNADRVIFTAEFGGTLPTGISAATVYFVISAATDTFSVSTTSGGSAVDITATGNGCIRKVVRYTIQNGNTVQFSSGQLKVVTR